MASVYILYSPSSDLFYIGSSQNLNERIQFHLSKEFENSFTAKHSDWQLYFSLNNLTNTCARKIETHIKKMKSRTYIKNLTLYPEISNKLIEKYN